MKSQFLAAWIGLTACYFACISATVVQVEAAQPHATLINFHQPESVAAHRPIIVAHRGGVITNESPECTLVAIELAASHGYDMVELDVQRSQDGVPILFHDRTLGKACGVEGTVADHDARVLEKISYRNSEFTILRLETALAACHRLRLGVMLDLKSGRDSDEFLQTLDGLLKKHQLSQATISISGSATARRVLSEVMFTPTDEEIAMLRDGKSVDLRNRFWFGLPQRLQPGDIAKLRGAGALVIPAINTFRYPAEDHMKRAKHDIEQLTTQAVDGFQIDSVYLPAIRQASQSSAP